MWRMDIDQPPPGTTAALSDWLIGEMAGFLARGSSGGSRLKTHDTQALRDNAAPVGSGRRRVGSERTGRRGSPGAPSNSLSARDFGATGNGATDDAPALQRAIDAAQFSRKPLHLPAGTYLVNSTLHGEHDRL